MSTHITNGREKLRNETKFLTIAKLTIAKLGNTKQAVNRVIERLVDTISQGDARIRDLITDSVNNATMQLLYEAVL